MTEALDFNLDPESLTIGEMEVAEEHLGMSMAEVGASLDSGNVPAKVMLILGWLALKRQNPDATLDDARALKLSVFKGSETAPKADPAPAPLA